jgi:hypothetical protein
LPPLLASIQALVAQIELVCCTLQRRCVFALADVSCGAEGRWWAGGCNR